jgi:hypothetical protein
MTTLPNHATDLIVAEIHKTFGRPPMVRNEDANAYDHILGLVIEAQQPKDFIETMLSRDFVNEIWSDIRNDRLVVAVLDARTRRRRELQLQRSKDKFVPTTENPQPDPRNTDIEPADPALGDEAETWAMHQSLDFLKLMGQMKTGSLQRKGLLLELMSRYRASGASLALSRRPGLISVAPASAPSPVENDDLNQSEPKA